MSSNPHENTLADMNENLSMTSTLSVAEQVRAIDVVLNVPLPKFFFDEMDSTPMSGVLAADSLRSDKEGEPE